MLTLTGVPDRVVDNSSRRMLSPFVAKEDLAELMVAIVDAVVLEVVAVGEVDVLAVTITGKFVLEEAVNDAVMLVLLVPVVDAVVAVVVVGVVVVVVDVVVVVPAKKTIKRLFHYSRNEH